MRCSRNWACLSEVHKLCCKAAINMGRVVACKISAEGTNRQLYLFGFDDKDSNFGKSIGQDIGQKKSAFFIYNIHLFDNTITGFLA